MPRNTAEWQNYVNKDKERANHDNIGSKGCGGKESSIYFILIISNNFT